MSIQHYNRTIAEINKLIKIRGEQLEEINALTKSLIKEPCSKLVEQKTFVHSGLILVDICKESDKAITEYHGFLQEKTSQVIWTSCKSRGISSVVDQDTGKEIFVIVTIIEYYFV